LSSRDNKKKREKKKKSINERKEKEECTNSGFIIVGPVGFKSLNI